MEVLSAPGLMYCHEIHSEQPELFVAADGFRGRLLPSLAQGGKTMKVRNTESRESLSVDGSRRNRVSSGDCYKDRSMLVRLRSLIVRREHGGALVEMAVAMPMVLLLMTGIFSFSTALYQKLQLAEAVSNGGRLLAVDRGDDDPCQTATSAIYAAAPGLNQSSISLTYVLGGVNYGAGVTSCPGSSGTANANMTAGGSAQVIATYPCTLQVYGVKYSSCNLGTQVTEVVQ